MKGTIRYEFTATVWRHQGSGGWFFVSLPQEMAMEIRKQLKWQEAGWGRLSASATVGTSHWKTAIWFDAKLQTYLLPIKAEIRRQEKIESAYESAALITVILDI